MENTNLRQAFIGLKVGESLTTSVDVYSYNTVRNYASDLSFALNRKYATKRDRAKRAYIITRLA